VLEEASGVSVLTAESAPTIISTSAGLSQTWFFAVLSLR
jgi:hypothetical protein